MNVQFVLERFPCLRILVIGDVMIDHYILGNVTRISPEAPVPVLHVSRENDVLGGAANVALNLAVLGVRTTLASCIGWDANGNRLLELLKKSGIETEYCTRKDTVPTIIKTRVIAQSQQLCRVDREAAQKDYALDSCKDIVCSLETAIADADAIIVSDYAKGCITQPLLDKVLSLGNRYGKLLAVDPKPSRKLNLSGVGLMTPNRSEALALAGIQLDFDVEYPLERVARKIHEVYHPELLVITLGADGMAICRSGKVVAQLPTEAKEVFDVSGAGDTVIATLTAALALGIDIVDAAKFANMAAGIVVSKMGTATASKEELLALA